MKDKVTDIIKTVVKDYGEQSQNARLNNPEPEMVLYGQGSPVDSIGLVSIIVSTELQLEEQFGVSLTLADEKAMSQRNSPFRTIDTMAGYIVSIMENNSHE